MNLICLKTVPRGSWWWGEVLETWPGLAGCPDASLEKEGHSWHVLHADGSLLPGLELDLLGAQALEPSIFCTKGQGTRFTVSSSLPAQFLSSSNAHIRGYETFYPLASSSFCVQWAGSHGLQPVEKQSKQEMETGLYINHFPCENPRCPVKI